MKEEIKEKPLTVKEREEILSKGRDSLTEVKKFAKEISAFVQKKHKDKLLLHYSAYVILTTELSKAFPKETEEVNEAIMNFYKFGMLP